MASFYALRRFLTAYPDFYGWKERSYWQVVTFTFKMAAAGHRIPAAELVASQTGVDWEKAVAMVAASTAEGMRSAR